MKPILYMGDDHLQGAAAYLGGVLTHHKLPFIHIPSTQSISATDLRGHAAYILSDFPAVNLDEAAMGQLVAEVNAGSGLLMIGGWESFHGKAGEYAGSAIEEALPVVCMRSDDRVNYCQGLVLEAQGNHPILSGIDFSEPPVVCGYNRVTPKSDSSTIISLRPIQVQSGDISLCSERIPLLVLSQCGAGRSAAFATDFAPHWVGGLVDWGVPRIGAGAEGGGAVEVGSTYAALIGNLVRWVSRLT